MKYIVLLITLSFLVAGCGTTQNNSALENTINDNGEETRTGSGNEEEEEDEGMPNDPDSSKKELIDKLKEQEKEGLASSLEFTNNSFVFTVENNLEEDANITFSSGQEYDYIVFNAEGKIVKKLSEGMMYTQAIKEVVLAPGEEFNYSASYDEVASGLDPGEYRIEFVFADKSFHASASIPFEVE